MLLLTINVTDISEGIQKIDHRAVARKPRLCSQEVGLSDDIRRKQLRKCSPYL